jgi:gliding-associated putative ABC transporter substrate-binding component GldG
VNGQPQIVYRPWRYYPVLNNFTGHPIVKNIDLIYSKFLSTIDTVKAPGVKKTPLVYTSKFCKLYSGAVLVDLNEVRKPADPSNYNSGPYPVAYLLEGNFESLYKNRPLPVKDPDFKKSGSKGSVFICSDADIVRNMIKQDRRGPVPVPIMPGNLDFVTNVVDYMLDEDGIINVRSKEIALRPLDKAKVQEDKVFWQIVNLVIPILIVLVFGVLRFYWRKKKYQNFPVK